MQYHILYVGIFRIVGSIILPAPILLNLGIVIVFKTLYLALISVYVKYSYKQSGDIIPIIFKSII